jgi:septal ring factor EnvC (AmiA/AmiB activator)
MSQEGQQEGFRDRLTNRGEDALGKLAQDLLENPLINGALARAFDAREKAAQAQEVAMGALNIPSAADIERLTRRLRSVSQRMEGLEDGIDRIERTLSQLGAGGDTDQRLAAIEEQLAALGRQLAELGEQLPGAPPPVSRAQERLDVEHSLAGGAASGPSGARAAAATPASSRRPTSPRRSGSSSARPRSS